MTDAAPLVSLCMIVRDNENTLPACLDSIRPYVDEIIVVDTGSVDSTPQIAAQFGAKLHHFPWCDDFAAARNESLKYASGTWLFWMDSDDTIPAENGRQLRELVERPLEQSAQAYVMQVHCPGGNGESDLTIVDHIKLFRNHPEMRFEGRIHEQILPAVRRLGGEVQWTDLFVVHSGSDHSPQGRRRKHERDLRILKLDLLDRPNHPFVLFNLGMTYGDMQRYEEGVEALRKSLGFSDPGESHVRKAYALLVGALLQLHRYDEAWVEVSQGRKLFPDDAELAFRAGIILHHQGKHEAAVQAYREALAGPRDRHFSSMDKGITGFKARHNLALVYLDQQKPDLAELQWRLAAEESPAFSPALRGIGQALLEQKRLNTAQVQTTRWRSESRTHTEGIFLLAGIAEAQGEYDIARQHLREALAASPEDEGILETACRVEFQHGDPHRTRELIQKRLQLQPHDPAALHNLGAIEHQLGNNEEAIRALERSLEFRPSSTATKSLLNSILKLQDHANFDS